MSVHPVREKEDAVAVVARAAADNLRRLEAVEAFVRRLPERIDIVSDTQIIQTAALGAAASELEKAIAHLTNVARELRRAAGGIA